MEASRVGRPFRESQRRHRNTLGRADAERSRANTQPDEAIQDRNELVERCSIGVR
jgi:hypothetical protein